MTGAGWLTTSPNQSVVTVLIKLFLQPTSSEMRFLSCLLGQCNRNQICQELPHKKGKHSEYVLKITPEAMNVGSDTAMPAALAQLIL